MCCVVFSVTSSGRGRSLASLIYALSFSIAGLTPWPIVLPLEEGLVVCATKGTTAAATAKPAIPNRLRRERVAWALCAGSPLFRSSFIGVSFLAQPQTPISVSDKILAILFRVYSAAIKVVTGSSKWLIPTDIYFYLSTCAQQWAPESLHSGEKHLNTWRRSRSLQVIALAVTARNSLDMIAWMAWAQPHT